MAPRSSSRARWQAGLACVGALLLAWRVPRPLTVTVATLATGLALLAWWAPARYAPVQRRLDWAGRQLVAGVSWLVLGLVYFGVFVPLRGWRALLGRESLAVGREARRQTYFVPLPPGSTGRFDRQF